MTIRMTARLTGQKAVIRNLNKRKGRFVISSNLMATNIAAEMRRIYRRSGRVNTGDLIRSIRARRLGTGLSRVQLGNNRTLRKDGPSPDFNYAYALEYGFNPRNRFFIGKSSAKGYFAGKEGITVRRKFYPAVNSISKAYRRVRNRMINTGQFLR